MKNSVKLSVVVSCYKQENYIADCLNSILSQKVNFDYEIVVADDFSPDKTREVILQFHQKYPEKIRLLFQEKNVGAAFNYISVHNAAQGEYVAHFDGDDIMLPGKLQAQVDVMDANPECNIVFHRSRYFSDDRSYLADTGSLFEGDKTIFFSRADLARWGTIAIHSSYMYRRSSRKTREFTQEFTEWFLAFESLLNDATGAYINKILAEYRCNENNSSYLASKSGREKAYLIVVENVIYYFNKYPKIKTDLYAHQIINIAMYVKNIKKIKLFMFLFLFGNIFQFRLGKVIESIRVRRMVGPSMKIR